MRLFLYYAVHSFFGTLRKLFKTWVAVFFAICVIFGLVIGIGAGVLGEAIEENEMETVTEEEFSEEEFSEEVFPESSPEETMMAVEALTGIAACALLLLGLWNGEKSGNQIFTMADVNLLFPSPRKPQSVLLFRLCTQMGAYLFATLYFIFQIPNLIWNLAVPPAAAWSLLAVLFFALIYYQLFSMLIFSLASRSEKRKGKARLVLYALLILFGGAVVLYSRASSVGLWEGAMKLFASPVLRFLPIIGWLKAIPALVAGGLWWYLAADLALLLLSGSGLVVLIWSLKVDFYEDALQNASEIAEAQKAAEEAVTGVTVQRKKDRSEKLQREMPLKGQGATVFFHKSVLNRFRLAKWGIFTKTGTTYLLAGILIPLAGKIFWQAESTLLFALPFAIIVFIRAFGNPIVEDVSKSFFLMIPEKAFHKVLASSLGGSVNTVLDLTPALIFAWVILGAPIYKVLIWFVFFLCLDFYAASFGMFTDLSLPEAIPQKIKASIQVLLIYASVVPSAAIIGIGAVLDLTFPFLLVASLVNFAIGLLFTALAPLFLTHGRK